MSLKSSLLFLLIISSGFTAKSQMLLNADSLQIIKAMKSRGGALSKSFIQKDIEIKGYYRKMIFHFPIPPEGNSCLTKIVFCLTPKNKCFRYYEFYWGEEYADKTINEFSKPEYGLKRVKNSLKWINPDKGFEARLIPKKAGKNKLVSVYILEININNVESKAL